ncbi:MAG: hypothetical protein ACKON7_00335 [Planctomycetaceae bacterium]
MIRRHSLVALATLALGFLVAAPAEAGGTSGAVGVKKNATVRVKNQTTSPYYVLVLPDSLNGSTKFGTPGTVGWARKLGAVLVNPGRTVAYPVPAGPGVITWTDPALVPTNPSAELPEFPTGGTDYSVGRGKTVTKTITSGSSPL